MCEVIPIFLPSVTAAHTMIIIGIAWHNNREQDAIRPCVSPLLGSTKWFHSV